MDTVMILNLIRNFLLYMYAIIVAVWSRPNFGCKVKIASGLRYHCRYCLKKSLMVLTALQPYCEAHCFTKWGSQSLALSYFITTWSSSKSETMWCRHEGLSTGSSVAGPLADCCFTVVSTPGRISQAGFLKGFHLLPSPKLSLLLKNTCNDSGAATFGYFSFSSLLLQNLPNGEDWVQDPQDLI